MLVCTMSRNPMWELVLLCVQNTYFSINFHLFTSKSQFFGRWEGLKAGPVDPMICKGGSVSQENSSLISRFHFSLKSTNWGENNILLQYTNYLRSWCWYLPMMNNYLLITSCSMSGWIVTFLWHTLKSRAGSVWRKHYFVPKVFFGSNYGLDMKLKQKNWIFPRWIMRFLDWCFLCFTKKSRNWGTFGHVRWFRGMQGWT